MTQTDEVKAYMESLGFKPDKYEDDLFRDQIGSVSSYEATIFYNTQKEAVRKVLDRVDKEVIGEDDEPNAPPAMQDPETHGANDLRAEQRQKLDSIIKELEG